MQITDVRVKQLENTGKLKGIASITFDGCFVVHEIKIIESDSEMFIMMPGKREANGQNKDLAHPINTETRNMIQDCVLKAYKETVAK